MFKLFKREKKEVDQLVRFTDAQLAQYFYKRVGVNGYNVEYENIESFRRSLRLTAISNGKLYYTELNRQMYQYHYDTNTLDDINYREYELSDPDLFFSLIPKYLKSKKLVSILLDNNKNMRLENHNFKDDYCLLEDVRIDHNLAKNCIEFEEGFELRVDNIGQGVIRMENIDIYKLNVLSYFDDNDDVKKHLFYINHVEDADLDCSEILDLIIKKYKDLELKYCAFVDEENDKSIRCHYKILNNIKNV